MHISEEFATKMALDLGEIKGTTETISKQIAVINKAVFEGNGLPPLMSRVLTLELKEQDRVEVKTSKRDSWKMLVAWFAILIPLIYHMVNTHLSLAVLKAH